MTTIVGVHVACPSTMSNHDGEEDNKERTTPPKPSTTEKQNETTAASAPVIGLLMTLASTSSTQAHPDGFSLPFPTEPLRQLILGLLPEHVPAATDADLAQGSGRPQQAGHPQIHQEI